MPQIQLLDGKKIPFQKSISGFELTKKISKSLEKSALIMEVDGELKDLSHEIVKDSTLIFICRSGARSRSAAEFLTNHGYKHCFNFCEGFEGSHDEYGHRGNVNGWKNSKLPWKQG